jgi:hypothetical protein
MKFVTQAAHVCNILSVHSTLPQPRLSLLDREGSLPAGSVDVAALLALEDGTGGPRYRCRSCGHPITSPTARAAVDGAHEHTRINPAGIEYRIGCFHAAPGCAVVGEETEFYSWFPGHAWRIAICRGCSAHLGWAFRAGERRFHGLIVERLVLDAPGPSAG